MTYPGPTAGSGPSEAEGSGPSTTTWTDTTYQETSYTSGATSESALGGSTGSGGSGGATDTAKEVAGTAKEQAQNVAGSAAQHGTQVAQTAKEQAGQVAGEAANRARDLAAQARDEAQTQAITQRDRAVGGLHALADELHGMADRSEQDGPASQLVRQAGQKAREVAGYLEGREPGELLDDVRDLARRRPGAFLAGAAIAGLALGRLTRGVKDASSSGTPSGTYTGTPVNEVDLRTTTEQRAWATTAAGSGYESGTGYETASTGAGYETGSGYSDSTYSGGTSGYEGARSYPTTGVGYPTTETSGSDVPGYDAPGEHRIGRDSGAGW